MRHLLSLMALSFSITLLGCGGDGGANTAEVSGTVKFDGKEIAEGNIVFTPADGKGSPGGGMIKDGKYTAKAPVGKCKVSITAPKPTPAAKAAPEDGPQAPPPPTELLPAKYNTATELTYEVKSGAQTKDWDLTK